jgi:RNA polymerase-interacting CarD/CdnL/TRCF family regulator
MSTNTISILSLKDVKDSLKELYRKALNMFVSEIRTVPSIREEEIDVSFADFKNALQ